jgi:hypothetical protein
MEGPYFPRNKYDHRHFNALQQERGRRLRARSLPVEGDFVFQEPVEKEVDPMLVNRRASTKKAGAVRSMDRATARRSIEQAQAKVKALAEQRRALKAASQAQELVSHEAFAEGLGVAVVPPEEEAEYRKRFGAGRKPGGH